MWLVQCSRGSVAGGSTKVLYVPAQQRGSLGSNGLGWVEDVCRQEGVVVGDGWRRVRRAERVGVDLEPRIRLPQALDARSLERQARGLIFISCGFDS